jgi:hypothetical protein
MKILITVGLLIVFISVFFILLTGESMFRSAFDCADVNGQSVCAYRGFASGNASGVFLIAFFIMVDIVTVYMILSSIGIRAGNRQ